MFASQTESGANSTLALRIEFLLPWRNTTNVYLKEVFAIKIKLCIIYSDHAHYNTLFKQLSLLQQDECVDVHTMHYTEFFITKVSESDCIVLECNNEYDYKGIALLIKEAYEFMNLIMYGIQQIDFLEFGYSLHIYDYWGLPLEYSKIRESIKNMRKMKEKQYLIVPDKKFVCLHSSILYIESNQHSVDVHMIKETVTVRISMKCIIDLLPQYYISVRRTIIVNSHNIKLLLGDEIVLANNERLQMSKSRVTDVLKALEEAKN